MLEPTSLCSKKRGLERPRRMKRKKPANADSSGEDREVGAVPDNPGSFLSGQKAAVPIMLGYFPTAAAFGLVAREAGLGLWDAVLVSAVIFAGASQFTLVGLAVAGSTLPVAAATLLFLNARHLLYGASLAPRLQHLRLWHAALGAFGLTDEVFAVCSAGRTRKPINFGWLIGLEVGAYASWVGGTWVGAAGGAVIRSTLPFLRPALSFALPALFLALLVLLLTGSDDRSSRPQAVMAAVVAGVVAAGLHLIGWTGWSILAASIFGPVTATIFGKLSARGRSG